MKQNNIYYDLYKRIEQAKTLHLEIISFIIYILLTIFVSIYHEPWYDEFQAWGISRESISSIIFEIPHLEGHPPLWYLVLKLFTSLNINPELSIKLPNLIFMYISVYLLIFKSPFCRLVRLLLPYTFFIFYQYAIVSRPYSMLTLSLLLVGMFHIKKDSHPYRYTLSLCFLSLTSLYGMIITTLLCLIWVYELYRIHKVRIVLFIKDFLKDRRFFCMLSLFFLCLFLSIICYPEKQVAISSILASSSVPDKILYALFSIFSDYTFMYVVDFSNAGLSDLPQFYYILTCILGLYISYILLLELKKRSSIRFAIILYILALFSYYYMFPYHLGVLFVLSVMLFWISIERDNHVTKFSKQFVILLVITLSVQIVWGVNSMLMDIMHDYAPSRSIAKYIKDNFLHEKYNIGALWPLGLCAIDEDGKEYYHKKDLIKGKKYKYVPKENTATQATPVLVNPYFGKNIFVTFNSTNPQQLYVTNRMISNEEIDIQKSKWIKPDIFFTILEPIQTINISKDYILVKIFQSGLIWKSKSEISFAYVYVHKNIFENYIKEVKN